MSRKLSALSVALAAAAGIATVSANPAAAGDVNVGVAVTVGGGHHHTTHSLPFPVPHGPAAYRGPALYYSYHYDHIPAYPVPVFPSYRPVVVHHHTVLQPAVAGHVAWCQAHYRSYRIHDNTFQPYHGPRRLCRSPYG